MIYGAVSRRRRERFVATFGLMLSVLTSTNLSAQERPLREVKPFLLSLESTPYNLNYYRLGLGSVHALEFSDGMENKYQPFFNRIVVQRSMNDGIDRLKRMEALSSGDFGTLGHEAFHAFKANYIEISNSLSHMKRFMERRAQNLYRSIPEGKRAVTLEEAYASFIGWVLQGHVSTAQMIRKQNPETCVEGIERLKRIWSVTWNSKVTGYWYRDSVPEYWMDQFKGIKILLTEGSKSYRDWNNRDGAIMVEEDLGSLDRRWISFNILAGKISEDFDRSFAEELKALNCEAQTN